MKLQAGYNGPDSMREKAKRMADKHLAGMTEPPQSMTAKGNEKTRLYNKGGHAMSKEQTDMKIPKLMKTPKLNIEKMSNVENKGYKSGGKMKAMAMGGKTGSNFADRLSERPYGKGRCFAEGGFVGQSPQPQTPFWQNMPQNTQGVQPSMSGNSMPNSGANQFSTMPVTNRPPATMKKGGQAYAKGGAVMEKEGRSRVAMDGERAVKKARGGMIKTREEMVGEKPSHRQHHFNFEAQMRGEHPEKKARGGCMKMAMGGAGKIRHGEMSKSGKAMNKMMRTKNGEKG